MANKIFSTIGLLMSAGAVLLSARVIFSDSDVMKGLFVLIIGVAGFFLNFWMLTKEIQEHE